MTGTMVPDTDPKNALSAFLENPATENMITADSRSTVSIVAGTAG